MDASVAPQVVEHFKEAGQQVGLLDQLALVLGFSLPLGWLATRLRLPAIVGFLAAGALLGPHTPGFIADVHLAEKLGEIGVIFLMFGVGLHFSIKDLISVKNIAIPGAIVQSLIATAVTMAIASMFGWSLGAGLVLGLTLSVASTVVLVRALTEEGELASNAGRIAVGWLVVEDLFSALVLVMLPILAVSLGGKAPLPAAHDTLADALFKEGDSLLGFAARRVGFGSSPLTLVVLTLINVGLLGVLLTLVRSVTNAIFAAVERTKSTELFTIAVVGVALVVAFGSMAVFGVSIALGAFFGGILVAGSPLGHQIAEDVRPFKDLFGVIFFAAVGMLFDPYTIVHMPMHLLAVLFVIMIVKPVVAAGLARALGQPMQTSIVIAAGLSQIGEFSFILATLGKSLGLIPDAAYQLVITGAIISIALNRVVFRSGRRLVAAPPPAAPLGATMQLAD
jgi:CPA2 family monovalent cation:H+ antiporter-2